MRQIILDTETTGLEWKKGNRVVEIGCVELLERRPSGRNFHRYLKPDCDFEPGAQEVTGLTLEFLADKPVFEDVVDEFLEYIDGAELIIHNAAFDVGFLNKELELAGKPPLRSCVAGVIDSLALAKEMFPGKRNSLDALCDRLEVDNSGRTLHGALLDAELLADVYINLTRGQDALLIDAGPTDVAAVTTVQVDLRAFTLPVIEASAQECDAHAAVLKELDKSSNGKTIWPKTAESVP